VFLQTIKNVNAIERITEWKHSTLKGLEYLNAPIGHCKDGGGEVFSPEKFIP
jgi:hypothetical protein